MNNLLPVDILMLEETRNGLEKDYKFPQYWYYNYNVNPEKVLEKLMNLNLILETLDLEFNLNSVTIPILKDFLRDNDLKLSGNKADLIERILDEIDKDTISKVFNNKMLTISDKAKSILEENQHIIYFNKNSFLGVSINEANELYKSNPSLSPFELAWRYLESTANNEYNNEKWGELARTLINMSHLLISEDKTMGALKCNLLSQYINLSGLTFGLTPEFIDYRIEGFFDSDIHKPSLNDYNMKNLLDYKYSLNLSDEEFNDIYYQTISKVKLPFNLLTDDEFLNSINYHFKSDFDSLDNQIEQAIDRVNSFISAKSKGRDKISKNISVNLNGNSSKGLFSKILDSFKRNK